ncbi:MAG TPA: Zn-dependent hydrolase [Hyphomicrobiaceae bacterium]|nr:Zn-dependent hydrolase [Hyphomicrobiaceae bacterium]
MPSANPERVLANLRHLAGIGQYKTGVHRPSLSPEHVAALHWLKGELDALGHDARIDGIGNVLGFSRAPGPKILAGSHLESQNHAGWLDGPLGVVYALEAARAIKADPAFAQCGVDVGAWCDEEGHFGFFMGSRSACGELTEADIDQAVDRTSGRRMRDALSQAGLAGRQRTVVDPGQYLGYLEAHIEQGDWLEANNLKLGIVTSIVGIRQFRVTFEGVQNHAGTTRMAIRKDAGLALARFVVDIDDHFPTIAGDRTVWTTGRIVLDPGAQSIIPGRAEMLFQIRDADTAVLDRLEHALFEMASRADAKGPCRVKVEALRKSIPAVMAEPFQAALEAAAQACVPDKHVRMPSGAGHDAQVFAKHMPAGMLFVPSIGGISHHWTENTSDEDIALGAQAFTDAVARLLAGAR